MFKILNFQNKIVDIFRIGTEWQRHIVNFIPRPSSIVPHPSSLCYFVPQCLCGYESIMQNKANFFSAQMNATVCYTRSYANKSALRLRKNKPNSKPNKANFWTSITPYPLRACDAFLVGRTIARKWIAAKVAKNEKFATIDEAVAQQGFKIVLLTRLSPVFPFNMLNYAFGLTKISFWKYALASWIGMMPGTVMYVYFGAGLRSLADVAAGKVEKGAAGKLFFWLGLVATIAVTVFVTRVARNALKHAIPQTTAETTKIE